MAYILTVYRFVGDKTYLHSRTELTVPKAAALETLAATREGLPPNFGATLTDKRGYNIISPARVILTTTRPFRA